MDEIKRDHKIYKYTNIVNGKIYIGRTCQTLEKRAGSKGQNYKSCFKFYNAIQKYGWDSFTVEILEDNLSDEEASVKELEYIELYDSVNNGYNIISEWLTNYKDKTRCSLSEAVSRSMTPEHRAYLSKIHTGKKMSDEARKKMSEKKKGVKRGARPEDVKEKIRQSHLGVKLSEEHRRRLSESKKGCVPWNKGKNMPDSMREKMRKANLGKKLSEETKRKISETNKIRQLGANNSNSKKVMCIETGKVYSTIKEASIDAGVGYQKVSKSAHGKKIKGDLHWIFI